MNTHPMQWILDASETRRARIREGAFFKRLADGSLDHMGWTAQLYFQSEGFIRALFLRAGHCRDQGYQSTFSDHATEEGKHPDDLLAWMAGLRDVSRIGVLPTPETEANVALCQAQALYAAPDIQVITLNVLSEGVALDFYSAVLPVLKRLHLPMTRYWSVHKKVDSDHLQMGLDLIKPVARESEQGAHYLNALDRAASSYHRMLLSWATPSADHI